MISNMTSYMLNFKKHEKGKPDIDPIPHHWSTLKNKDFPINHKTSYKNEFVKRNYGHNIKIDPLILPSTLD